MENAKEQIKALTERLRVTIERLKATDDGRYGASMVASATRSAPSDSSNSSAMALSLHGKLGTESSFQQPVVFDYNHAQRSGKPTDDGKSLDTKRLSSEYEEYMREIGMLDADSGEEMSQNKTGRLGNNQGAYYDNSRQNQRKPNMSRTQNAQFEKQSKDLSANVSGKRKTQAFNDRELNSDIGNHTVKRPRKSRFSDLVEKDVPSHSELNRNELGNTVERHRLSQPAAVYDDRLMVPQRNTERVRDGREDGNTSLNAEVVFKPPELPQRSTDRRNGGRGRGRSGSMYSGDEQLGDGLLPSPTPQPPSRVMDQRRRDLGDRAAPLSVGKEELSHRGRSQQHSRDCQGHPLDMDLPHARRSMLPKNHEALPDDHDDLGDGLLPVPKGRNLVAGYDSLNTRRNISGNDLLTEQEARPDIRMKHRKSRFESVKKDDMRTVGESSRSDHGGPFGHRQDRMQLRKSAGHDFVDVPEAQIDLPPELPQWSTDRRSGSRGRGRGGSMYSRDEQLGDGLLPSPTPQRPSRVMDQRRRDLGDRPASLSVDDPEVLHRDRFQQGCREQNGRLRDMDLPQPKPFLPGAPEARLDDLGDGLLPEPQIRRLQSRDAHRNAGRSTLANDILEEHERRLSNDRIKRRCRFEDVEEDIQGIRRPGGPIHDMPAGRQDCLQPRRFAGNDNVDMHPDPPMEEINSLLRRAEQIVSQDRDARDVDRRPHHPDGPRPQPAAPNIPSLLDLPFPGNKPPSLDRGKEEQHHLDVQKEQADQSHLEKLEELRLAMEEAQRKLGMIPDRQHLRHIPDRQTQRYIQDRGADFDRQHPQNIADTILEAERQHPRHVSKMEADIDGQHPQYIADRVLQAERQHASHISDRAPDGLLPIPRHDDRRRPEFQTNRDRDLLNDGLLPAPLHPAKHIPDYISETLGDGLLPIPKRRREMDDHAADERQHPWSISDREGDGLLPIPRQDDRHLPDGLISRHRLLDRRPSVFPSHIDRDGLLAGPGLANERVWIDGSPCLVLECQGVRFDSYIEFLAHWQVMHAASEEVSYICSVCREQFGQYGEAMRHMLMHPRPGQIIEVEAGVPHVDPRDILPYLPPSVNVPFTQENILAHRPNDTIGRSYASQELERCVKVEEIRSKPTNYMLAFTNVEELAFQSLDEENEVEFPLFEKGTGCPVKNKACRKVKFETFSSFDKHWKKFHVRMIWLIRCSECKAQFRQYYRAKEHPQIHNGHCFMHSEKVINKFFIDPGEALKLFRKKPPSRIELD